MVARGTASASSLGHGAAGHRIGALWMVPMIRRTYSDRGDGTEDPAVSAAGAPLVDSSSAGVRRESETGASTRCPFGKALRFAPIYVRLCQGQGYCDR